MSREIKRRRHTAVRRRCVGAVSMTTTRARRDFSRRGLPPSDFERELLSTSTALDDHWVAVGRKIGADALFDLLDELGSMIVSVPTRESFVGRLYLPVRDAEIAQLSVRHTDEEIATLLGLTREVVRKARGRALRTRRNGG